MQRKCFILLFFLLTVSPGFAQKEFYNWFFGQNATLTWSNTQNFNAGGGYGTSNAMLTGIPTAITPVSPKVQSPMSTMEGCFSVSDGNGNLMFFSDGITVWDKKWDPMPNANPLLGTQMTGNPSSSQSGVIIPYPGNSSKYIAITIGAIGANNPTSSVIDITQRGGLGDVIASTRNTPFLGGRGTMSESITAVVAANRSDYWIVAPGRSATSPSYLNVWKVTSAGVHNTAPTSIVSVNRITTPVDVGGYIKFTPDAKHFAWIDYENRFFAYGDFNNTTGVISNIRVRDGALGTAFPAKEKGYGIEFTNDVKYIYLTYIDDRGINYSGLQVFDFNALLATSTPNLVAPIKQLVNTGNLGYSHFGAIQKGPDGRMYISALVSSHIWVIDNPTDPTNMKIYTLNNILGPHIGRWGLPNFSTPWFQMLIISSAGTQNCSLASASYQLEVIGGMGFDRVTKVVLSYGDGASVTYNNPTLGIHTDTHIYDTPGLYTITATAYNSTGGVELSTTSTMKINSCVLRVNPHIRGINE